MAAPGMHPRFETSAYTADEVRIINRFAREWFLTTGMHQIVLSEKSVYRAFLGRLCEPSSEMFNLDREIIVVFSSYEEFEARTIDAFDYIAAKFPPLRTDPICRVLISKDRDVSSKISQILKNDPELPVIIPFTYDELISNLNSNLISNRFRQHFFTRDLFAFESPLKRDTYFFGRTDLINRVIARHKSNENWMVLKTSPNQRLCDSLRY